MAAIRGGGRREERTSTDADRSTAPVDRSGRRRTADGLGSRSRSREPHEREPDEREPDEREPDEREPDERAPDGRELNEGGLRSRQRAEFGGISWLSALVGWLAAAGLAAILTGILGAAGAVLAVTRIGRDIAAADAETIGLAGGIALLVVLAIAYGFGGYAAGRMARFDGARQGFAVWIAGILAAGVVALLTLVGGAEYDVLDRLSLPRIPIDSGTLTSGGLVVLLASLVVTLGAAIAGAKAGERFHRRVDRAGPPG
jgi:hypothetical protein